MRHGIASAVLFVCINPGKCRFCPLFFPDSERYLSCKTRSRNQKTLTQNSFIMERKTYSIAIDAPKEKVWNALWDDASYRAWTAPFSPTSYAKTDWKKGSEAQFLDGKGEGMVAVIADNKPNEFMSIRHIGMVSNGVVDTESEKVKQWAGAMENYTLTNKDGKTEVLVEIDITADYLEYFDNTWPKALNELKRLAEQN